MDLAIDFDREIANRAQIVNEFIDDYLKKLELTKAPATEQLRASMSYSAMNGGKRFRPVLALFVGEIWGAAPERILPFAAAIELVHTYSLIHDDLPCMDNDDMRRGKPTNHKVYGEDLALLAGDALLTEAFHLLTTGYGDTSFLLSTLVRLISEVSGVRGMVGGQAIDLRASHSKMSLDELVQMHSLKTGALIRGSAEGAAIVAGASAEEIKNIQSFGESLGLAFQIADDILDHGEKDQSERSFTGILGLDETRKYLNNVSEKALSSLRKVTNKAYCLEHLINFNQFRKV